MTQASEFICRQHFHHTVRIGKTGRQFLFIADSCHYIRYHRSDRPASRTEISASHFPSQFQQFRCHQRSGIDQPADAAKLNFAEICRWRRNDAVDVASDRLFPSGKGDFDQTAGLDLISQSRRNQIRPVPIELTGCLFKPNLSIHNLCLQQ